MEALRCIMPALTASSVALVIGAVTWEAGWNDFIPESSSAEAVHVPPSWSLAPLLYIAGAVLGSTMAGPAAAQLGNRIGMAAFDAVMVAGLTVCSVAAAFPAEFVWQESLNSAGKLSLGIGTGGLCGIVPAYVGDVADRKLRGRLGLLFPALAAAGVLITTTSHTIFFGQLLEPSNIVFYACCMAMVVVHSISLCFIPESPYFIPNSFFTEDPFVESLLDDFQRTEHLQTLRRADYDEALRQTSWRILNSFVYPDDRKAALVGVGSMFFHQMCGIIMINTHLVGVMKTFDLNVDPITVSVVLGAVQVIMAGVGMALIDKRGRRWLLVSSAVAMSLCVACLTLCIFIKIQENVMGVLSTIFAVIFILAYHIGFGPVPFVIVGEIYSTKFKPYGTSLSSATNWLMVPARVYFPYVMYQFVETEYVFSVHIVVCLLAALFAWKIVPETKNASLLQGLQPICTPTEV